MSWYAVKAGRYRDGVCGFVNSRDEIGVSRDTHCQSTHFLDLSLNAKIRRSQD